MKHASITLVVLALFTPAAFAACAGGSETASTGVGGAGAGGSEGSRTTGATNPTQSTGTVSPGTGGASGTSTTTTTTTGGGTMCAPKCTSDQECQTTCPSAGNSLNCCDTATGTCYVTGAATCPSPTGSGTGAGGSMMTY